MQVINGDINEINPNVVEKVQRVEREEGYEAEVTLNTFGPVLLCNVRFAKPGTDQVAFTSLNLYDTMTRQYVFNMNDGKVSGFEMDSGWVNVYREMPEGPEQLASEVLFDLFGEGWD